MQYIERSYMPCRIIIKLTYLDHNYQLEDDFIHTMVEAGNKCDLFLWFGGKLEERELILCVVGKNRTLATRMKGKPVNYNSALKVHCLWNHHFRLWRCWNFFVKSFMVYCLCLQVGTTDSVMGLPKAVTERLIREAL